MNIDRYKKQIIFYGIGEAGQQKLLKSRVTIIGMGALGSVIANGLARAGVGYLRLIDRDYVDWSNLQRQVLFTEEDAKENLPKVIATKNHLTEINSEIEIEAISSDVNSSNIEGFIQDVDLVVDGTDNFEIRGLINEACDKHQVKWIYGGALASGGATMNILQGEETPCFRCFMDELPEEGTYDTCSTVGVTNAITGIIASFEVSEAIKILTDSDAVSTQYLAIDTYDNLIDYIDVEKNPNCPVCGQKQYTQLDSPAGSLSTSLCGTDSWQVASAANKKINLKLLAARLENVGDVNYTKFILSFKNEEVSFKIFPDGRAIFENVRDGIAAKTAYAEYIGL
ncbi:MAG: ThiF family adenylyltransferase [Clostridiales Family XIII bacterium]|jgi:adenylyltransferase/sulfurtransferase|nr:ThiF family adenylyltransferase [Clostridiales Family XIII bacterium]